MKRRSSLRLIGWPMPPTSGDVRQIIFSSLLHLVRGILNGLDDVLVPGTTAQIPRNPPADLFFVGAWVISEQGIGRHQHAGRAESTLQAVLLLEPFLQRMQLAVLHQP